MRSELCIVKIKAAPVGLRRLIDCFKIKVHINFSFIWCKIGLEANITHILPSNTFTSLAQNSFTTPALIFKED